MQLLKTHERHTMDRMQKFVSLLPVGDFHETSLALTGRKSIDQFANAAHRIAVRAGTYAHERFLSPYDLAAAVCTYDIATGVRHRPADTG